MTTYDSRPAVEGLGPPPLWICTLLGIVLVGAGILALSDVVFATIISVKLIGLAAILAGAFEIAHALWTKGWGGFLWQILLGVLYVAFGFALLTQPETGAVILTFFLGAVLFGSGLIRCVLSFAHWRQSGWLMLISGLFGVLASILIAFGFPTVSLWALGFLLGIDLISHGLAWLLYAFHFARKTA